MLYHRKTISTYYYRENKKQRPRVTVEIATNRKPLSHILIPHSYDRTNHARKNLGFSKLTNIACSNNISSIAKA